MSTNSSELCVQGVTGGLLINQNLKGSSMFGFIKGHIPAAKDMNGEFLSEAKTLLYAKEYFAIVCWM